jgi:hypothetical protein
VREQGQNEGLEMRVGEDADVQTLDDDGRVAHACPGYFQALLKDEFQVPVVSQGGARRSEIVGHVSDEDQGVLQNLIVRAALRAALLQELPDVGQRDTRGNLLLDFPGAHVGKGRDTQQCGALEPKRQIGRPKHAQKHLEHAFLHERLPKAVGFRAEVCEDRRNVHRQLGLYIPPRDLHEQIQHLGRRGHVHLQRSYAPGQFVKTLARCQLN